MAKIRLKHIDTFIDRHNERRYYFRRDRGPRVRLPGEPGSKEFMDAYAEALHGVAKVKPAPGAAGTFAALVTRYMASSKFTELADVTRGNYGRVLDSFVEAAGERSVAGFTADRARGLIEDVQRDRGIHPAYGLWRVLRGLMEFAQANHWRADNPMLAVKGPKRKTIKGYATASIDEVEQFRAHWPLGSKPRLALELLFYTAARRTDIVKMGRPNVKDGVLKFKPQKTGGVELSIAVTPELHAALESAPKEHLTFIVTEYGAPFTANGFTAWFKAKCRAAGLRGDISPHSMRKGLLTYMADNGATAYEMQAVSGHQNVAELQPYTKAADQKRLAKSGLAKLAKSTSGEQEIPNPSLRVGKNA